MNNCVCCDLQIGCAGYAYVFFVVHTVLLLHMVVYFHNFQWLMVCSCNMTCRLSLNPFGNGPCLCCAISWLMWHGIVILWLPDGFILTCASLSKGILCIVHECAGTCTIMPHVIRPTCIVCYSCYGVVGPFLFGCAWVTQEDIFTHCFLFVQWHWRAHMLFMYLYASDADWRAHMFFTWMCVCIMIVCFSGCACCVGVWHMSWMAR